MFKPKNICPLLLLLLLFSCKGDFFDAIVDVDVPEHTPRLTVAAHFNELFENFVVDVGHSAGILDNSPIKAVKNAKVELLEDEQLLHTFDLLSVDNEVQSYYVKKAPIDFSPEKYYTLKINSEEYGQVQGTQVIPTKVLIEQATYKENSAVDRYGERGDAINLQFTDPANEQNYYQVLINTSFEVITEDSSFVIADYEVGISPVDPFLEDIDYNTLLLSDASFDGASHTIQVAAFISDQLRYEQFQGGWLEGAEVRLKEIDVTLLSTSKDYYLFQKSLASHQDNEDNFFAEPTNVYENVEGGIGIFTLSTGDTFKIEF